MFLFLEAASLKIEVEVALEVLELELGMDFEEVHFTEANMEVAAASLLWNTPL